jgi:CIC family chloride channel protein
MDERERITTDMRGWRNTLSRVVAPLSAAIDRVQLPEEFILVATSVLVGVGTGLGAVALNLLIQGVSTLAFVRLPQTLPGLGRWAIVLVPTLGGLVAGPLIYYFAREAKGHGVPEVMQAIALNGGRIRPIVAVIKALASALTLGTGGSVGREGPIVQIGAALGSSTGQALRLSDERIKNLVACGAAGGIAATFNAPIAGVIFALEVILGELSIGHVGSVVIAAVTANTLARALLGTAYAFPVPQPYAIRNGWEFFFYAILGILAALVATAFVRTLYGLEDVFDKQKLVPEWAQPAVGGLLLGVMGLCYPLLFPSLAYQDIPQVFGGGYAPIDAALSNQVPALAALALIVLKLLATDLTLGSGGSGGIFAPSLFMGAMLGVGVGTVVNMLFPSIAAAPGAYALVGMGAVFAGAAHAPITALIMLFELTGDYRIILPLMFTVVIATLLARRLLRQESIYTLKLTRRGIRLQHGRDVDVMQAVTVAEIMQTNPPTVPPDMTLTELSETLSNLHRRGLPVVDGDGLLWGIVTIEDLDRAIVQNMPRQSPVAAFGMPRDRLLVAYPEETMGTALARLSSRGRGHLPVVDPSQPSRLVGWIRREDIIRAYSVALARRAELQHRAKRIQLRNIDGTEFVEILVSPSDHADGQSVQNVARGLPSDCILVSIRRGGRMLIPHGDTVIYAGDRITAFAESRKVEELRRSISAGAGPKQDSSGTPAPRQA